MSLATLLGGHAAPQDEQSADAYAGASIADLLGNSSINSFLFCNAMQRLFDFYLVLNLRLLVDC